ncbi:MAG: cation:proton antiporter [Cyanobacteria bacterium SZAS LIN-3]|nr:cation:proton antiporter [Cyanobacteria bacterium SZAS LIN-3]
MPEAHLLQDLLIVFGLGVAMVVAFHRLNLPSVLGFLITGVITGPYGLGLVADTHAIQALAEIGLVLLLFEAGIEFSVKTFIRLKRFLLIAGSLQLLLTIGATVLLTVGQFALPLNQAIFLGMVASLSSTALVIRILEYHGHIDAAHGRAAMAILIYQDLILVPMVLMVPYLAGNGGNLWEVAYTTGKALVFVAVAGTIARFLIPWLLSQVARIKKREAFVLSIMLLCLGTALATAHFGMSMALGAFVAGLVISESKYSHQALSEVLPIREILNCLVFVSIGMLFDPRVVIHQPLLILLLVASMMLTKTLMGFIAIKVGGLSWRVALLAGVTIAQVSEFSFVLAKLGLDAGVVDKHTNELLLAVAILSMFLTPGYISLGRKLEKALSKIIPAGWGSTTDDTANEKLSDHVIVVGYNLAGRNLCQALTERKIPFAVVDFDPIKVKEELKKGLNISYGDASRQEVLKHAGIDRARAVVLTPSDPDVLVRATEMATRLNPDARVICRVRYNRLGEDLKAVGADTIVAEDLASSSEINRCVLAIFTTTDPAPAQNADQTKPLE